MDFNIRILIADDFKTMRRIVKGNLKQLGFENVVEVENGEVALNKLKTDEFDLIISDWNMPKLTGLELLQAVRSNEKTKHIPFIMVTAEGKKDNVLDAMKAGVTNYIMKPFTLEVFEKKVKAVFEK